MDPVVRLRDDDDRLSGSGTAEQLYQDEEEKSGNDPTHV